MNKRTILRRVKMLKENALWKSIYFALYSYKLNSIVYNTSLKKLRPFYIESLYVLSNNILYSLQFLRTADVFSCKGVLILTVDIESKLCCRHVA